MGAPSHSQFASLGKKNMVLENNEAQNTTTKISRSTILSHNSINGTLWNSNVMETQRENLRQRKKKQMHMKKNKRVLMMKRRRITRRRQGLRNDNGIEKRIRTLKRLIPNRKTQGLDEMFKDAASYIMSLQMRVRVMQVMVDVLECSSREERN